MHSTLNWRDKWVLRVVVTDTNPTVDNRPYIVQSIINIDILQCGVLSFPKKCVFFTFGLGKPLAAKMDDFLENFQGGRAYPFPKKLQR